MNPLSIEVEIGERSASAIYSESRALLDYGIHGKRVDEWIVSHEVLRRQARKLHRQNAALNKQVAALQKELSK